MVATRHGRTQYVEPERSPRQRYTMSPTGAQPTSRRGRSCGATDNASDYGSEDSRFESWQDRFTILLLRQCTVCCVLCIWSFAEASARWLHRRKRGARHAILGRSPCWTSGDSAATVTWSQRGLHLRPVSDTGRVAKPEMQLHGGREAVRLAANEHSAPSGGIYTVRRALGSRTRFGGTYTKIGTIQRRLAWPLRKDDTQNREAFHIFYRFWPERQRCGGKRTRPGRR